MQLYAALCCACGKVAYRCCYALVAVFNRNFNRSKVFLIFFLCGGLKILTLKINTLQIKLQISEKYL